MSEKENPAGAPTKPEDGFVETPDQAQAMLDEIMARSIPKAPDPPGEDVDKGPPPQAGTGSPQEKAALPSPPGKNKRSSFYVYLLILFGAAFMMLLLAYFVQQRNNESAISDLRNSMTLSRKELMEQIEALETENESLQQDKELLNLRLNQVKMERDSLQLANNLQSDSLSNVQNRTNMENVLHHLERFVDAGDWLMAGAIVAGYDWYFNSRNVYFTEAIVPLPSQTERYLELREAVVKQNAVVVEEVFRHRWSEPGPDGDSRAYYEQPKLQDDGRFQEQDCQMAGHLAGVLAWYPTMPETAAACIAQYFQDAGSLDQLDSGAFKQSTVDWFEQVKADLTAQNYLTENENGTMSAVNEPFRGYGEDGSTAGVSRETSED